MSEMETSLSHRLIAAVDDEIFGYICPGVTGTAPAEKAVVAVLRELAKRNTGVKWAEHFGTSMIHARDLRKLADEIEAS